MNRETIVAIVIILLMCAGAIAELSTNSPATVRTILSEATSKTEGLFEAGSQPSKDEPAFDLLQSMLTVQDAEEITNLLVLCENKSQRQVLMYAFQAQSPSVYMTLLENLPDFPRV